MSQDNFLIFTVRVDRVLRCATLPRAGGSDAVAAGEGLSCTVDPAFYSAFRVEVCSGLPAFIRKSDSTLVAPATSNSIPSTLPVATRVVPSTLNSPADMRERCIRGVG